MKNVGTSMKIFYSLINLQLQYSITACICISHGKRQFELIHRDESNSQTQSHTIT